MGNGTNRDASYKRFRSLLFTKTDMFRYIPSGSFFELPLQYFIGNPTDIDVMFMLKHLYASVETNQIPSSERSSDSRLLIDTSNCHIGFARLRNAPSSDNLASGFYRKLKISVIEDFGPTFEDKMDISEKSKCTIIQILLKKLNAVWEKKTLLKVDHAYAVLCPFWSDVANEWKTRKRENGWPPDDVRDKIFNSGCHLVSKPHKNSPDDDTQWRFSFSLAEVILIQHWTHVQRYIYHILRLIKSEIVKACGGENQTALCTYFFKTLMLWSCEEKPQEFWREENIETAVGELLCIMIEWLIEKRVPNYFIPENNMIDHLRIDDDLSSEISLLIIQRTSYLQAFICNVSNCVFKIPISLYFPKELIEWIIINHECYYDFDAVADDKLNSLSESRTFLQELDSLFNGLTLQKTIGYKSRKASENNILLAIRYFEQAMRTHNDFSPVVLDFRDSIANIILNIKDRTKDNCDLHFETVDATNAARISSKIFGASILSNKNEIIIDLTKHLPSPVCFLVKTYYVNFLYATLKDYKSALGQREKIYAGLVESETREIRTGNNYFLCNFHILLTNEWSKLFDDHIQAVLGFLNLFSAARTNHYRAVVVNIHIVPLLDYIYFQSARYLRLDERVLFDCDTVDENSFRFSYVYGRYNISKTILMAAVSTSGIKPIRKGPRLIACHFSS